LARHSLPPCRVTRGTLALCAALAMVQACRGSERGSDETTEPTDESEAGAETGLDGAADPAVETPPEVHTVDVSADAIVLDPISSEATDAGLDADGTDGGQAAGDTGAAQGPDGSMIALDGSAAPDAAGPVGDAGPPGKLASAIDLLFMVDNSGSMTEEQVKLAAVLDDLVLILTSGRRNPANTSGAPDFRPIESLHIGVVSSDMGVNGAPAQKSCGALSFLPDERETTTATQFLIKPQGDDGLLQTSTQVAVTGVYAAPAPGATPQLVVPGDPSCQNVTFPPGQRFLEFRAGISDPAQTAHAFNCIARLGKNGCGLEQQLESVLKATTPPTSPLKFTLNSNGQGNALQPGAIAGPNAGFLRDDALLVVVLVSDEEDCSSPDSSRDIYDATLTTIAGQINVRCGLPENQHYLHNVSRYVDGLRALKAPAYQSHIVLASIVGIPLAANTGAKAHTGASAMTALLERADMAFKSRPNAAGTSDEPVPACSSAGGTAAPGRRFLELSRQFGDNAVAGSICEDEFSPVLNAVIDRIVTHF
jgi:hypothetical protein